MHPDLDPVAHHPGRDFRSGRRMQEEIACAERPSSIRSFARFSETVFDDAGNCRSARVEILDRVHGEVLWGVWRTGRRFHLGPFDVELADTRRAGLHLVCHHRRPGVPEPRFVSVHPIREQGVFVLSPANVAALAEPLSDAVHDEIEQLAMRISLVRRYGWSHTAKIANLERRPRVGEEQRRSLCMSEAWD